MEHPIKMDDLGVPLFFLKSSSHTFSGGVKGPPRRSSQEVFGGPSTYSQGIGKTRVMYPSGIFSPVLLQSVEQVGYTVRKKLCLWSTDRKKWTRSNRLTLVGGFRSFEKY